MKSGSRKIGWLEKHLNNKPRSVYLCGFAKIPSYSMGNWSVPKFYLELFMEWVILYQSFPLHSTTKNSMNLEELSKEQQVMVVMRKVLTGIIREITPQAGDKYPLSEQTITDIRMCLQLIAAREQELAKEQGITNIDKPYYADEPPAKKTVPLHHIPHKEKIH